MITKEMIEQAERRIAPYIHRTPLLTSLQLNERCGNAIYLKAEHLQKTGAFKIRGAANKVTEAVSQGARYVTAASSGNHGQAVAYIANALQIEAKIVVPEDASLCKIEAIEGYNSSVEKCGYLSSDRIPRAKVLANKRQGVFIPPYDDPLIMAGQGTIGLEILSQLEDVDAVVVPIGGGGLISGIATAIKESNPAIRVIGVEPETANDTYLSLAKGEITPIAGTTTIADGLRTIQPGDLTFPVVQKYVDEIVLVSEDEIKEAFTFVLERMKQLIEPSSATVVAACMFNKLPFTNKRVVAVISGGNVDVADSINLIKK